MSRDALPEVVSVRELERARALLNPVRVAILGHLEEPRTCHELADLLGQTQQRLNHHLKDMLKAKLLRIVRTNRRGNLLEAVYGRVGKAYWLSPDLTLPPGVSPREFRDRMSLHNLLVMAETLREDAVSLLGESSRREVPSIGFEGEVVLRDEAERENFTKDILAAFQAVVEKYQARGAAEDAYKVLISCYPNRKEGNS